MPYQAFIALLIVFCLYKAANTTYQIYRYKRNLQRWNDLSALMSYLKALENNNSKVTDQLKEDALNGKVCGNFASAILSYNYFLNDKEKFKNMCLEKGEQEVWFYLRKNAEKYYHMAPLLKANQSE